MQYLSVARDIEGESGIVRLDCDDIIFLQSKKSIQRVAFHTLKETFFLPGTLKYWASFLVNSGYNYRTLDRNFSVNVNKIVLLDSMQKRAYFSLQIDKQSKYCTMAHWRYEDLVKEFLGYNPNLVVRT